MRRIDELHLNYPFAGSRTLRRLLWQQGLGVGNRHIKTLMKRKRQCKSMVMNALFYHTLHGVQVGDLFMSLIHTCQ